MRLHHVQILCPREAEDDARAFYGSVLGLSEMPRPSTLSKDGVWYRLDDTRQLHVGTWRDGDEPPRSRAHFALVVSNLDTILNRLRTTGISWTEPAPVPGWRRVQLHDPFDNHLELIELAGEANWDTT